MHPQKFMDAILQRPEDDTPRLRYASWLDERDNPRGELIRLQCALASSTADVLTFQPERREQQLLAQYHAQWSEPLADYVEWCSFRRGFIEEVSLTEDMLLRHACKIFRQTPVQDIHLKITRGRLDELPELSFLSYTVFLDLSAQPLGDQGVEYLSVSPMLARVHGLNLGSTFLGDVGLDALVDSPDLESLRELYLNDNPITDDSIRRFVMSPIVEHLEVLDVRNTQISAEAIGVLRHILGKRCLA